MQLEQQNILFFLRTMEVGGTEQIVLQICRILKDKVNKIVVCSCGGSYTAQLEEIGIRHYTIPDITQRTFGKMRKTYTALNKLIRDEEITIVHTHHRMAAFYAHWLQRKYHYVHIVTAHNIFENKKYLTRLAYAGANIIACGEAVKENLVDYFGIGEDRVKVIRNSVEAYDPVGWAMEGIADESLWQNTNDVMSDPADDILVKLRGWKEEGYYLVGNIARLEKQKGINYFIQSFPMVKEHCSKLKYIIVGDGSEYDTLKKLAEQVESEAPEGQIDKTGEDILFLGRRENVRNIMACMDLLVMSSLWEGYPLVPIEAFSVGKTLVATSIEGIKEIVTDQENGILVPSEDPKALAEGIAELLTDQKKREQMEKMAYDTYCEEFSWTVFAKQIEEYYFRL